MCRIGSCHCQCVMGDGSLQLTILDGTSAWSAKISRAACEDAGDRAGGVLGDTWDMAREAFVGGSEKYDIVVKEEKLVWRKVGGKAKIKIMDIPLDPVSFLDAQNRMFAQLVESNRDLKNKNKDLQRRQDNLVRDLKKSKSMLREFEQEKSKIEDAMYERFLPILNSKKERIRELEKLGPKSVHAMSEDEADDYGSATDEDEPDEVDVNNEGSKKRPKLMLDDSLGLLDDSLSLL